MAIELSGEQLSEATWSMLNPPRGGRDQAGKHAAVVEVLRLLLHECDAMGVLVRDALDDAEQVFLTEVDREEAKGLGVGD